MGKNDSSSCIKNIDAFPDTFSFNFLQIIYFVCKRIIDIVISIIGCFILIPFSLIIKLIMLFNHDNGSILYTQMRIGKNGKPFKLYKYRSMIFDADNRLIELMKEQKYHKEWENHHKLENDPRITRMGSWLRKTSFDELPQFINVLKGDMSLIGPRPLVENELEIHNGSKVYNCIRPGMTGWWACNGRSNIDYSKRLELEYFYIMHVSLYLDMVCLVKTIIVLFTREGSR